MKKLFNIINLAFFTLQSFFTTIFTQAQDLHLSQVGLNLKKWFVDLIKNNLYRIPGSDLKIEKGMRIWVNIVAIHMDTKYYETPNVFNPEHFNDEAKAERHR